jgi:PST family polysaccharide transporter
VAFGQGLIAYFSLLTDYGFDFSATRRISVERDDPEAVSRTAFNVWAAKGLICTLGFVVLLAISTFVPKLHAVRLLLIILYGIVIGRVLFPRWLFQGMEKMVIVSAINLAMQGIITIGIFALIRQPQDHLLYAGLLSGSSVFAGLMGIGTAFYALKLVPQMPSLRGIWEVVAEGWTLFLSMASLGLFTAGNAFILGLLTDSTIVGYYSVAERIMRTISGMIEPISAAVYPRFSHLVVTSRDRALSYARWLLILMGLLGALLSAFLFFGADAIVQYYLGASYIQSAVVMRILSPFILINAITNVLGVQIMLPLRQDNAFLSILFGAGIINVLLAFVLVPSWKHIGMALAVLSSAFFVLLGQLVWLNRRELLPFMSYRRDLP